MSIFCEGDVEEAMGLLVCVDLLLAEPLEAVLCANNGNVIKANSKVK